MVEIVVSMFLIGLMAMAVIPLLLQGMQAPARNTRVATATQLVSESMAGARARGTTCADLTAYAPESATVVRGGVSFEMRRALFNCPREFPATVQFEVTAAVTAADFISPKVLASAVTLILVSGP